MKREPLFLYLLRLAVGLGVVTLLAMLYWSSSLMENDLKLLQQDILQLRETVLEAPRANHTAPLSSTESARPRPHIDPSLANLLQEDTFYTATLPNMLGKSFKPKGTFHSSVLGKPDNLHPFSNWYYASRWRSQCIVSVASLQFGKYETLAPDMAIKMEERKSKETGETEFWIHLRDQVYWEPLRRTLFPDSIQLAPHFLKKHQVTAHDFKFYFDAVMNLNVQEPGAVAQRTYLSEINSVEVIDDLTFIVRWKQEPFKNTDGSTVLKTKYIAKQLTGGLIPLASFVYKYFADGTKIIEDDSDPNTYRTNSIWAQNFSQHWAKNIIVSCGPWIFDGMTERQIRFIRNPNFYSPYSVLAQAQEVTFKDSFDAMWQDFKNNELDTYEARPDQLLQIQEFLKSQEGAQVSSLEYLSRIYSYIGWNEAKPYFNSKKVRQALTMAIDRQRIVDQYLNGLGIEIHGSFFAKSKANDPSLSPWPFNPHRARHLLAEEGWYDSDGDGIIDKEIDGKREPFRFRLTYFVKNMLSKTICEYVSTALKEVGIECTPKGVDQADLSATFDDKGFDAIQLAWVLGTPPEDPRQIWSSEGAKEKGSSNTIGFANKEVDALIHELEYESDPEKRQQLYHQIDAILYDEAPYVFLYTPKTFLLYRNYVQNVFLPIDRQDLIPGADVAEPSSSVFWLKQ